MKKFNLNEISIFYFHYSQMILKWKIFSMLVALHALIKCPTPTYLTLLQSYFHGEDVGPNFSQTSMRPRWPLSTPILWPRPHIPKLHSPPRYVIARSARRLGHSSAEPAPVTKATTGRTANAMLDLKLRSSTISRNVNCKLILSAFDPKLFTNLIQYL